MNIDEFRALKAQQAEGKTEPKGETPDAQTQQGANDAVSTPPQTEADKQGAPTETAVPNESSQKQDEPQVPTKVEIDGKEVDIEELKKGYMRTSDYTRKTQEISRKAKQAEQAIQFMDQVKQNPEVAQQLAQHFNVPTLDPAQMQMAELQDKYYDLVLQNEIRDLENKYSDFDAQEVLQTAQAENLSNLDTAYHVVKSRKGTSQEAKVDKSLDVDKLREELRSELMTELKREQESQVDTSSIIQSGGDIAPVGDTGPVLSSQEIKVATRMGMKPEEYAQWRDATKKTK